MGFGVSRSRASRSAPSRTPARLPRSAPHPAASASRGDGLGTSGDMARGQLPAHPLGRVGMPLFREFWGVLNSQGFVHPSNAEWVGDVLSLFVSLLWSLLRGGDSLRGHRGLEVGDTGSKGVLGFIGRVPMTKGSQGQGTTQGQDRGCRDKGVPGTRGTQPGTGTLKTLGSPPQSPSLQPFPGLSSTPRLGNFWDEITHFVQLLSTAQLGRCHARTGTTGKSGWVWERWRVDSEGPQNRPPRAPYP